MLAIRLHRETEYGRTSVASRIPHSYSGLSANQGVAVFWIMKVVLTELGKKNYITPMLSNLPKEKWNIDGEDA